eukprot:4346574-Pleurochrysis_carterae.AAC.2
MTASTNSSELDHWSDPDPDVKRLLWVQGPLAAREREAGSNACSAATKDDTLAADGGVAHLGGERRSPRARFHTGVQSRAAGGSEGKEGAYRYAPEAILHGLWHVDAQFLMPIHRRRATSPLKTPRLDPATSSSAGSGRLFSDPAK